MKKIGLLIMRYDSNTEPWWYFCKVCKQRLSKTDAMTICDDCLVGLDDREIGRR